MEHKIQSEYTVRQKKLEKLNKLGVTTYPDHYVRTKLAAEALKALIGSKNIKVAGRIVSRRTIGKISFCHLLDDSGKIQIVIQESKVGEIDYKNFIELIDIGDFLGAEGELFKTQAGEISILVKKYTFLGKALRPLPGKWHGLKDIEKRYRERYLDLVANHEVKEIFRFRSRFIQLLREFYWSQGFIEIETPILAHTASGAMAKPFTTHHNALDIDLYLRISCGEIWQKMAIIGSFEKTFELGRVFRNEGIDPSHLQEFTMLEHYCAYWNFEDNMRFTEKLLAHILKKLFGTIKVSIKNAQGEKKEIDFTPPWPKTSYRELIKKDSGIDIDDHATAKELLSMMQKKKIKIEGEKKLGRGSLIDALYKEVSRKKIIQPTFLIQHPIDVSPLARSNDKNPSIVDRFQLVAHGWEIVNAYSELVDPIDQKSRFNEQSKARKQGDEGAHAEDKDFVTALEHGAPPISGWGMGIDRIVALLTGQDNLRDVVLFPILRPEHEK